jgi:hypothetical protein
MEGVVLLVHIGACQTYIHHGTIHTWGAVETHLLLFGCGGANTSTYTHSNKNPPVGQPLAGFLFVFACTFFSIMVIVTTVIPKKEREPQGSTLSV